VDNGGRTSRPLIDTQSPKKIELMARLRSALNKIFCLWAEKKKSPSEGLLSDMACFAIT
jgi:hypothetical protein